ncbi:MAG: phosphoribosylamine--glycine ligase [Bdellovibrionales bacterium]|nr:phosphoribosylamine--glycine ligase [Bdellovibrionales bacterium]
MNILVLGSGGREHALAWKIAQSPLADEVFLHPGNAGTQAAGFSCLAGVDIADMEALVRATQSQEVELVVVGPEALLAEGYADAFRRAGVLVVGPSKEAALLESSKIFAKQFMKRAGIPTSPFQVMDSSEALEHFAHSREEWPAVLKVDGLAAGKGVVIAQNPEDVLHFSQRVWIEKEFGTGPQRVLVEEFLKGREVSYIGLCDSNTFIPLPTATDYKRVGDGDIGPNTGGMGCVSPSPFLTPQVETRITKNVIGKLLAQLEAEKMEFRGALFIGLMLDDKDTPNVLEFNVRFGDPETQATLPRLKSDFLQLLIATARGELSECPRPEVSDSTSIYVVAAAEGYPGPTAQGDTIEKRSDLDEGITLFYSGVAKNGRGLVTKGGRVLGVGCLESDRNKARDRIYDNLSRIHWRGMHYRRDIGT